MVAMVTSTSLALGDTQSAAAGAGAMLATVGEIPAPFLATLGDDGFDPALITVVPGQTIVISNTSGGTRTITSGDGTFDSGPVPSGQHYALTFPSTGTWTASDDSAAGHTATITVGTLMLPGDQSTPANSVIPDALPPDAPQVVHPELGIVVSRNRILVSFTDAARVPQANAALAEAGVRILGGIRDLKMLVGEVADAGTLDLDYMQSAIDTLRAQPGVRTAAYDFGVDTESALPRPADPDPSSLVTPDPGQVVSPYTWEALVMDDETIRGTGMNYGLEAARFPQAWNWLDAIRMVQPGNGTKTSTIVLDQGFDKSHPDLAHAKVQRLCTPEQRCTENRIGVDIDGDILSAHGNATAGIVGALFDRGPADSPTSEGTVGGDPMSGLHLVPYFTDDAEDSFDVVTFASFAAVLDLILDKQFEPPFDFYNLRVINLSAGPFFEFTDGVADFEQRYGRDLCGPGADDDTTTPVEQKVACSPNNQDTYVKEFRAWAELLRPIADRLAAYNVLLVVAAGNDGLDFCADRPRADVSAPCTQRTLINTASIQPFGYLASTWPAGSVPPWVLVEANFTTTTTMTRAPYSNGGGTLSAGGTTVVPFVDANFQSTYNDSTGTSMAAPLVTAAAGLLSNLAPNWQTVRRLLVERGPIDLTNSNTPRLDVFSAMLGLPANVGIDALLDVNDNSPDGNRRVTHDDRGNPTGEDTTIGNTLKRTEWSDPDGAIDMRDFRRFRDAWLDVCSGDAACPELEQISLDGSEFHPKRDMNLDGCFVLQNAECVNLEGVYSRVDFNGDGTMVTRAFPILLDANGQPTSRAGATRMTDLDVFESRFGQGPNANTEGWTTADLEQLLVSADVELRLDKLWEAGAVSAEVTVSTIDEVGPRRTFAQRGTGDVQVYSMPIAPLVDAGNADLIQVRVVATLPGDSTVVYLSPPLEVKAGQDVVVVPCTDQFVVRSAPGEVTPGGMALITATLTDCTGRPVANSGIEFEIASGPNGSSISVVNASTDADGIARTVFTYPEGVNSAAQVVARAYPAIDGGERLQRSIDLGPAADVVIHYRFRQTILDYERTTTNDWGPGADDCDGATDAGVSPANCFVATQEIRTDWQGFVRNENGEIIGLFPFGVTLGELERTGTITPNADGGATIDEEARSGQSTTSPNPDSFDLTGINVVTTVEEWDPANPTDRVTHIYDSPIVVQGQPAADEFADLPPLDVPTIDFAITDGSVQVNNLRNYADGYALLHAAFTLQRGVPILPESTNPDLPIPNLYQPLQQLVTDLALVPRADSSSLAWDWNPDAALTFTANGDGTYQPVTWCGTRQRLFDNADDPGYWNDLDPAIESTDPNDPGIIHPGPYRDPDEQRTDREAGDRAAPQHSGSVTSRFEFVAVVTRAGDPAPDLQFETCTDSEPTPIVGWQPGAPVEGQAVEFLDLSSYADDAISTEWRFADSAGSNPSATSHEFSDNGVYSVDFTVVDSGGTAHVSEPAAVTVQNAPPTLAIGEVLAGGTAIRVKIDDAGQIDRQQLEVRLTSPTPGWPAGGFTSYSSPPTDPLTLEPMLGEWTHTVNLPTSISPGVYFVVLTVLDKDGGKATQSFTLAVAPPVDDGGGASSFSAPLRSGTPTSSAPLATPAATPPATSATIAPMAGLSARSGVTAAGSPPPTGPVPAFVVDRLVASTGELVTVRNATRTGGSPSATRLTPGDGRPPLDMAAGSTLALAYSAAGEVELAVGPAVGANAALTVTISGPSLPAEVGYSGATTAPLGALLAAAAHATSAGGADLPGVVVRFALGGESVEAVSGPDGVASAELAVTGATGTRQLTMTVLPDGDPVEIDVTVTANAVPVADAGGPYVIGLGAGLSLEGAATDADADESAALTYSWDLNGDGVFGDALGTSPLLTPGQVVALLCGGACAAGETAQVTLRATDPKGGHGSATSTVTIVSDFLLTINPATATLVPNANVSFTVSVITTNGFSAPVALSAPGLPPGVTATFDPPTVTPNGTSLLNLRAGPSITEQDFDLVVRGTSGSIVRETGGDVSLDFGLVPQCFGAVSGRITDPITGAGVPGVNIFGATTDAQGNYSATNLTLDTNNAPRTLFLSSLGTEFYPFSPQVSVRIACGVASTLNIQLLRRQYGTLTGIVTGVDHLGNQLGPINQASYGLNLRTGPNGRYTLTQRPLGPLNAPVQYGLTVEATGYHSRTLSTQISAGATSTLDFSLLKVCTGSIRVRVVDQRTGLPIQNAQVDLGAGTTGGGVTNADGIYVINGVGLNSPNNNPTTRNVRARTPTGVAPAGVATRNVVVGSCGAQAPIDIPLPFPRRVESRVVATVVDDTGAPVQGATVRIGSTNYSPTGVDGKLVITHLLGFDAPPTLNTAVTAFKSGLLTGTATAVTLTEGQTTTVTITLYRPRYGTVVGTVRDRATGAPLEGMNVSGEITGPDGRFVIDEISLNGINQPRDIGVSAYDPAAPITHWNSSNATVTVSADTVTVSPDLLMTRVCAPATIRGRVINAVTRDPIEGVLVRAGNFSALTGADGRFVISGVSVGTNNQNLQYTVTASKTGFVSASKNATVSCNADVVVDFGNDGDGVGSITGTITTTGGSAVSGAQVTTGFGGTATTAANGTYTIPNAPAGVGGAARDWAVHVTPPAGSPLAPADATVSVSAGQVTTRDFVLESLADAAPVAASFAITIEPAPVDVTLAGADPTNDPLTFTVTKEPENGTLSGTAPDLVYTPDTGFAGVDTIEFVAEDGSNTSVPGVITVTVLAPNGAPTAVISGPLTSPEGTRAFLSGAGSTDPEAAALTYAWDLDGDGLFDDDLDASASVRLFDDGVVPVALRVTDPRGGVHIAEVEVTFTNVNPDVMPLGLETDGLDIAWFGEISEPGDDTVTGTIDFGDGMGPRALVGGSELDTSGFVILHTFPAGGTYTMTLVVCDDDGGCTSVEQEVVVVGDGNQPPIARITAAPAAAFEDDTVQLSGTTSSDADGTIVAYAWDLDDDGAYDDGTSPTASVTLADDGTIDVRLRVTDDIGATATRLTTVTFANVEPVVDPIADLEIAVGESIAVDVLFTDPGADEWTLSVDWNGDGTVDETTPLLTQQFTLAHQFATAGTHTVLVEVCDDDEGCGEGQATVTVLGPDEPPVAAIDAPATVAEGSAALFDGGPSTDPDGAVVAWAWDLDGDGDYDDSAATQAAATCTDDGQVDVALRVTDDDGNTDTTTASVLCTNVAPLVAPLANTALQPGDTLARGGSFSDPGTDTWTATVDWGEGDGPEALATNGQTFALSHLYADAGTFTVTVSVCDDDGDCGETTTTVVVAPPPPDPTADLTVDTHHVGDFTAGSSAEWLIDITNAGPDPAQGVTLTDVLPTGAAFSHASGSGWSCELTGTQDLTCVLAGGVPLGSAPTLTITVTLDRQIAVGPDALANTATVSATTADPDPSDNVDTDLADVAPAPPSSDLSGSLTVSDFNPEAGSTIEWSVSVDNAGPDSSGMVTATIDLPPGWTFVGQTTGALGLVGSGPTGPVWVCDASSVSCTTPDLAVGETTILVFQVRVANETTGPVRGGVAITAASADPDPSDNEFGVDLTVRAGTAPTTTTTPGGPPRTLPATGGGHRASPGIALALAVVGVLLVWAARRRPKLGRRTAG